ncbi:MAG: hypothetical protein GEU75_11520 [Dehalococcoidia bacterium]|nr:hypothetical protein [Dehalococcoidia bacterium]
MKCTKCDATLVKETHRGIEVDACPTGHGMWLDLAELDQLEDKAFDEDELKGTLVYSQVSTTDSCPHCGSALQQFQYRLYDITLEYCPSSHGYWLDKGESERVTELMDRREGDMERSAEAQKDWAGTLKRLRSPSFVDKLTGLFK